MSEDERYDKIAAAREYYDTHDTITGEPLTRKVPEELMAAIELVIEQGRPFGITVHTKVEQNSDGVWMIDPREDEAMLMRFEGMKAVLVAHMRHPGPEGLRDPVTWKEARPIVLEMDPDPGDEK